jgi:hypothetical protein
LDARVRKAIKGNQVLLVRLDSLVILETKVQLVHQDLVVLMDLQGQQGLLDQLVIVEIKGKVETLAQQGQQGQLGHQDQEDSLGHLDPVGLQDKRAPLVPLVPQGVLVREVSQEMLEIQVHLAQLEIVGLSVLQVQLERRVIQDQLVK